MEYKVIAQRREELLGSMDGLIAEAEQEYAETIRVKNIAIHTRKILDDLDGQFRRQTGLVAGDVAFLFTAAALQVMRQYLLTRFPEPLDDRTAAQNTLGHKEEHSARCHRLYEPSLEEVLTNPVPFDALVGADGALRGGGKMGHRVTAIGHDPLLGLIFGTANIATSTLTTSTLASYHIYTNGQNRDYFRCRANTGMLLKKTVDKVVRGGAEGRAVVAASLAKEIIHLRSDLYTANSLPLPVIPVLDSELAGKLGSYGLNMANVLTAARQVSYAALINSLIAWTHRLFGGDLSDMEEKAYEVRTRKIILYSDLIATSSNLVVTAVTRDSRLLDIGGFAVTLYRLFTDRKFIREVKEEFVFGQYREQLAGTEADPAW